MNKLGTKYVLIDRGGFSNKGAELMVNAAVEKLQACSQPYVPVIGHINGTMSQEQQHRLGLKKTFMPKRNYRPRLTSRVGNHLPQWILNSLARIKLGSIDTVFDVGGFRFGDQWNKRYAKERSSHMADFYKGFKKKGGTVVFLPQALGPFETELAREWFLCAAEHADLIFAREQLSYEHAKALIGEDSRLKQCSDFTNLCEGTVSETAIRLAGQICVIPNSKMIDHSEQGERYIDFLAGLLQRIRDSEYDAFLLNHEGSRDLQLCEEIRKRLGAEIPIVEGLSAKDIKGVIGNSYVVLSSRYHGVVSALSQGIPCLCTSWSHKYPLLLKEYECEDALIGPGDIDASLAALDRYIDPTFNREMRDRLTGFSAGLKARVEQMWDEILTLS